MKGTWRKVPILVASMGLCFAAGVWASDGIEKVEAFLRPDFKVLIDGKEAALDKPVLLYDDSSYLPLRKISELLNADVFWKEETHSIYINTRYPGQPENPSKDEGTYNSIEVTRPYPYQADYLGGTYVLVSAAVGPDTYYRVDDLAKMGVDVRGLVKSKDVNTGALYALQDDVNKLWKETPYLSMTSDPLITDTTDPALLNFLKDFARNYLPAAGDSGYLPKVMSVPLIDAVSGHPGWYAVYGDGLKGDTIVFMLEVTKNVNGDWVQKSLSSIPISSYAKFFDDDKKS